MADNTRLISGGVNYFIEGGTGTNTQYNGSGTPWTVVTTSPYEYAMNDVAGKKYTPLAPARQEVYGGGQPIHDGADLLYDTHGNQIETLTIQCRGTTYDNSVFLLLQLRNILNTALYTTPCILAFQPNGASQAVYYEILGADVQEDVGFTNDNQKVLASGHGLIRAVVTWRKKPFGGRLSTGETLLSGLTFTNTGTGANNNTQAYGTGGGDMINEGSPLNIKWKAAATTNAQIYMASVIERLYSVTSAGAFSTSSQTGVVQFATGLSFTNQPYANNALKGRVLLRFSALNALTQLRVIVFPSDAASTPIYTSPWVTPPIAGATLVDMGAFDLSVFRYNYDNSMRIGVYQRSTTGGSATMTFTYMEVLAYYTFASVEAVSVTFLNTNEVRVMSFIERTNAPVLAKYPPLVGVSTAGSVLESTHRLRGEAPRYYAGASLYLAWLTSTFTHGTADTAVVTGTHAPQFNSLRGAT